MTLLRHRATPAISCSWANRDNPKALGDFRYIVDDSPQAKAKAKPTP
jgi:hypothetical protein